MQLKITLDFVGIPSAYKAVIDLHNKNYLWALWVFNLFKKTGKFDSRLGDQKTNNNQFSFLKCTILSRLFYLTPETASLA